MTSAAYVALPTAGISRSSKRTRNVSKPTRTLVTLGLAQEEYHNIGRTYHSGDDPFITLLGAFFELEPLRIGTSKLLGVGNCLFTSNDGGIRWGFFHQRCNQSPPLHGNISSAKAIADLTYPLTGPRSCAVEPCPRRPSLSWGWFTCRSSYTLFEAEGHSPSLESGG